MDTMERKRNHVADLLQTILRTCQIPLFQASQSVTNRIRYHFQAKMQDQLSTATISADQAQDLERSTGIRGRHTLGLLHHNNHKRILFASQ